MALKACRECNKEVAASATVCPHCGVQNPAASQSAQAASLLFTVLIIGGLLWYFFGGGLDRQAASGMHDIYAKVAQDAVEEYRITTRSGSTMDRCVHAGLVAAAFLQAKDDASYAQWKRAETADCRAAGVPR